MVFAMQIGQFIGTRADFVPEPICKKLSLLQDKVSSLCSISPAKPSRLHELSGACERTPASI